MSLGGQTVGFVTVIETGEPGRLGLRTKQRITVSLSGVQFWSMTTTETPDTQTDVATEVARCIAPPEAAVLAAASTGEIVHNGKTYQIQGPIQPRHDLDGVLHHVTIMCKRQAELMARNALEKYGIREADLLASAEADANLNDFMQNEVVPYARSLAPVESGKYAAGIKVTKKARGGKGVVAATDFKSHWIEFGSGAPGPTNAYAVMEKTAQHFGGTLDSGVTVGDE